MPPRAQQQQQSIAPIVVAVSVAAAGGACWYGFPGFAAIWLGVIVAAWMEPPPLLTGKKDTFGYPTPNGPGEQTKLRRFQMWAELKWKLLVPSADWLPGWPVCVTWIAAVVGAGLAAHAPANLAWFRIVNAVSVFLVVAVVSAVRRRHMVIDDVCPGVRTDSVAKLGSIPTGLPAAGFAVVSGVAAGVAVSMYSTVDSLRFAPLAPPEVRELGIELPSPLGTVTLSLFAGLAVALAVLARPLTQIALGHWHEIVDAREQWKPRWDTLKLDPAPWLVDTTTIGPAELHTFDAPPGLGALGVVPLLPKLTPILGAGVKACILDTPNLDGQGQPVAGTAHPTRFQVAVWPTDQMSDLTSPETAPDAAELLIRSTVQWAHQAAGYGCPVLVTAEPINTDDSEAVAWRTTWGWPMGPNEAIVRDALLGDLQGEFGVDVLIDHRTKFGGPAIYIGTLFDNTFEESESGKPYAELLDELANEDRWNHVWSKTLKRDANPPTPHFSTLQSQEFGRGAVVNRLAFVTREGDDPTSYFGLEPKLAAALTNSPFVTVTGWPGKGDRPGDRFHQAFCLYWSESPHIPAAPDRLPPSPASRWIIAGHVNQMFTAAKMARPEIVEAEALTSRKSDLHVWKVTLRLYGGVTLADVRGRADRLRTAAGVPWLRVEPEGDVCTIYLGAEPARVELAPKTDATHLESLDWSQAFVDSGVRGVSGGVPVLTESGILPNNDKVRVLDFDLPTGVDLTQLKESVEKLKVATGNLFIDARAGAEASQARLLVCADNPLAWPIAVDFEEIDRAEKGLPFATDVAGEAVLYNVSESPHVLVAGQSGSGKSVAAQTLVYGALVQEWELWVLDASKGGADFGYAEQYAQFFARDVFQCAAAIKTVYDAVVHRKDLNTEHSVGSYKELPDDVRPHPIAVVIDEFTSLIGTAPLPPKSDDPEMMMEREKLELSNLARMEIGTYVGKIAREARSAGVTIILCTQKLMSDSLQKIPNGGDLKDQLARVLLGKASTGQKMSTLRDFENAPKVQGEMKPGRGLWESSIAAAEVIQAWFATQDEYGTNLAARNIVPVPDKADVSAHLRLPDDNDGPGQVIRRPQPATPNDEIVDVGEVEFSLDDLSIDLDDLEIEPVNSEAELAEVPLPHLADTVLFLDIDGVISPTGDPTDSWPDWGRVDSPMFADQVWQSKAMLSRLANSGATIVWLSDWGHAAADQFGDAIPAATALEEQSMENGWWKIDAALSFLDEHPEFRRVVWLDDHLDADNPLGGTHRDVFDDLVSMLGLEWLGITPSVHLSPEDMDRAIDWMHGPAEAAAPTTEMTVDEQDPVPEELPPSRDIDPGDDFGAVGTRVIAPVDEDLF